jgi:hypothetical protein
VGTPPAEQDVATRSEPSLPAAARQADLRAARIVDLPTPALRTWNRILAATWAVVTLAFLVLAATDTARYVVVAVVAAYTCAVYARRARAVGQALGRGSLPPASRGSIDESALQPVAGPPPDGAPLAMLEPRDGLADIGSDHAGDLATRFWRRRKPRQSDRYLAATRPDLAPAEAPLVTARAMWSPTGPPRLLIWFTLGVGALLMIKDGHLTVTESRLLYHRHGRLWRRRRPDVLVIAEDLAPLEILEWHGSFVPRLKQSTLVLRRPDGSRLRFDFEPAWAEERQLVFETIASRVARPPDVLAERWGIAAGGEHASR